MQSDHQQWLERRRKGIGGSDAAAILGLSRYRTPYAVWLSKVGEPEPDDPNPAMEWGLRLEPAIRQAYCDRTGRTILLPPPPGHVTSSEYPWMCCTPDGYTDDGRLIEIKTSRSSADWGEEGTDHVPPAYLVQVQHNMAVMGLQVADVPVLFGGHDFRIYEVPADPDLQAMLVERERAFWQLVESRTPPPPVNLSDVVLRFRESQAQEVVATPEVEAHVETLRLLQAQAATNEQSQEGLKFKVLSVLGEADTLVDSQQNVLLTWKKSRDGERLDGKALKAALPEVWQQFAVPKTGSRVLLIKGAKETA